jgi:hypothetical protein
MFSLPAFLLCVSGVRVENTLSSDFFACFSAATGKSRLKNLINLVILVECKQFWRDSEPRVVLVRSEYICHGQTYSHFSARGGTQPPKQEATNCNTYVVEDELQ